MTFSFKIVLYLFLMDHNYYFLIMMEHSLEKSEAKGKDQGNMLILETLQPCQNLAR